jgi:hypothetical protein
MEFKNIMQLTSLIKKYEIQTNFMSKVKTFIPSKGHSIHLSNQNCHDITKILLKVTLNTKMVTLCNSHCRFEFGLLCIQTYNSKFINVPRNKNRDEFQCFQLSWYQKYLSL